MNELTNILSDFVGHFYQFMGLMVKEPLFWVSVVFFVWALAGEGGTR